MQKFYNPKKKEKGFEEIPREGSKVDCTSLPWATLLPTWQNVVGSLGLSCGLPGAPGIGWQGGTLQSLSFLPLCS